MCSIAAWLFDSSIGACLVLKRRTGLCYVLALRASLALRARLYVLNGLLVLRTRLNVIVVPICVLVLRTRLHVISVPIYVLALRARLALWARLHVLHGLIAQSPHGSCPSGEA